MRSSQEERAGWLRAVFTILLCISIIMIIVASINKGALEISLCVISCLVTIFSFIVYKKEDRKYTEQLKWIDEQRKKAEQEQTKDDE